jgi:hypothetical protein
LPEPGDEELLNDDVPSYEDPETDEDNYAPDINSNEAEVGDPFFVPSPSLLPVKWIWIPAPGGKSRLIWATLDLVPRLSAIEIFRLFLTKVLNAIYDAELSLYHDPNDKNKLLATMPPSPLDLQGFFLKKWLSGLVSVRKKRSGANNMEEGTADNIPKGGDLKSSKQFSWEKQLSNFTIAVPSDNGYCFIQPSQLIYCKGSGGKYIHRRKALFMRWMGLECKYANRDAEHFHDAARIPEGKGSGWFFYRMNEYVKKLNTHLEPSLGENIFGTYSESTLRDALGEIRREIFPGYDFAKNRGRKQKKQKT